MSPLKDVKQSRLHFPFPRHTGTPFVSFETKRCAACGECVARCPHEVLGIIGFFFHRHVHVDRAAACEGCRRCMAVCPHGVITSK